MCQKMSVTDWNFLFVIFLSTKACFRETMRPMQPGCLDQGCTENKTPSQKSRIVGSALGCISMACWVSSKQSSKCILGLFWVHHFGCILETHDAFLLMPLCWWVFGICQELLTSSGCPKEKDLAVNKEVILRNPMDMAWCQALQFSPNLLLALTCQFFSSGFPPKASRCIWVSVICFSITHCIMLEFLPTDLLTYRCTCCENRSLFMVFLPFLFVPFISPNVGYLIL